MDFETYYYVCMACGQIYEEHPDDCDNCGSPNIEEKCYTDEEDEIGEEEDYLKDPFDDENRDINDIDW